MKKRLGLALLFIVGLSILLYPTISNQWNEYREEKLIVEYGQEIAKSGEDLTTMLEAAQSYNVSIAGSRVPDAFSIRDGVEDPEYEALLNVFGNGMMGYVEIPCINVEIPIYHYTTEAVLEKGAGHLFGSSLPVGGENTHAVISAHRGLPSAKLFTDLDRLEIGNQFYIHVLDQTLAYQVDQIQVVEPCDTDGLGTTADKDYVTLLTCTPYAVNTHRLLVRGYRVPFEEAQYQANEELKTPPPKASILIRIGCAALGVIIALIIVGLLNLKNRKKTAVIQPEDEATEKNETEKEA